MSYKFRQSSSGGIDWLEPKPALFILVLMGVFMPSASFIRYEDAFSFVWPFSFCSQNEVVADCVVSAVAGSTFPLIAFLTIFKLHFAKDAV